MKNKFSSFVRLKNKSSNFVRKKIPSLRENVPLAATVPEKNSIQEGCCSQHKISQGWIFCGQIVEIFC
jgi:hypothetical protein